MFSLTLSDILVQFFVGWLFGIIETWKRKVGFIIIVILVIGILIEGVGYGNPIYTESWLEASVRIITCGVGIFAGSISYKGVFEK